MEPRDARGYHPVRTLMQTVALCDRIDIRPARRYRLTIPQVYGDPERNLITRAYRLGREIARDLPVVSIACVKNIPAGAGLGGGSADGAAVLRWVQACSPLSDAASHAHQLGMDVPFLVRGGTAAAAGYGEQLQFLAPLPPWPVLLASPGFGVPTDQAYRAFDQLPPAFAKMPSLDQLAREVRGGQVPPDLFNGLERAAWAVRPALRAFKETLERSTGLSWFLSGSGSVYFSLNRDREILAAARRVLRRQGIPWTEVTHFVPSVD